MDGWVGSDGGYRFNTYLFVLVVQEHLATVICPAAVAAAAAPHHGPVLPPAAVPPAGEELKDDSTLQLLSGQSRAGKTKQRRVDSR